MKILLPFIGLAFTLSLNACSMLPQQNTEADNKSAAEQTREVRDTAHDARSAARDTRNTVYDVKGAINDIKDIFK